MRGITATGVWVATALCVQNCAAEDIKTPEGLKWDITDVTNTVTVERGGTIKGSITELHSTNPESTIDYHTDDKSDHGTFKTSIYGALNELKASNVDLQSSSEITLEEGANVKKVWLKGAVMDLNIKQRTYTGEIINDSLGTVKNYGEIRHVTGGTVENYGVLWGIAKVADITNMGGGLLDLSAVDNTAMSLTNNRDAKINLHKGSNLLIRNDTAASSIVNEGEINLLGGGLEINNASEIMNTGRINITGMGNNNGDQHGEPIQILLGDEKTVLTNTGSIISDGVAVLVINRKAGGEIILANAGLMQGGIEVIKAKEDPTYVSLNFRNYKNGVWRSTFTEVSKEKTKSENDYGQVVNEGLIEVKGNTTNEPATITSKNLVNYGEINIEEQSLTINGEYEGKYGGTLVTRGVLAGDETVLPTLTIKGTVGGIPTKVRVNNIGGAGAATVDGIKVVTADSVDGEGFVKEGRIIAGVYDYDLVKVQGDGYTEWRLTSELTPEPPGPTPPVPPGPTPPVPPKPVHKIRPEAGAYAENLRQANTLFLTGADQRRSVGTYTDAVTGRTETSTLWLSQTGGHTRNRDASGQLSNSYNHYTVQLGGSLFTLPAGDDGRLDFGVQGGYGHARGDSHSALTGYRARGTVSGYSTGFYSTWRQHQDDQSGGYVSTTLQYSWLRNQVKGDDLAAEKYDARGTTLSLEGGYDYAVWQGGEQNGDSLFIRPQAQVTRMGVKADEHREANGTRVRQQGDGSVFSRTGVRVWLDKAVSKAQRVQPFVETNWLHNTRDFCSSMNGAGDCLAGNRNQAEVLAGVKGDVSPAVAVTAQAGGRFGSQASRDLAGTLNVSVTF
ncbi:autotransporter outer membrane beta-barrel domain-containing protein [Salmonella enterica]|nr:autotransporter outer membrane beta-barrel domain-containing protein [Salmonella enterica]EEU4806258.1 autotransporter outer membrane beta-barrel domain-containing protein [Salmonella enterica]EEU4869479.1 autotransporter outer membrane beta-barrel domain-containing protein [Salmonella enterica]EEU4896971.1 autotransporter outer membrane beta-barrel domain-containing protein [Salmonella enterica]